MFVHIQAGKGWGSDFAAKRGADPHCEWQILP